MGLDGFFSLCCLALAGSSCTGRQSMRCIPRWTSLPRCLTANRWSRSGDDEDPAAWTRGGPATAPGVEREGWSGDAFPALAENKVAGRHPVLFAHARCRQVDRTALDGMPGFANARAGGKPAVLKLIKVMESQDGRDVNAGSMALWAVGIDADACKLSSMNRWRKARPTLAGCPSSAPSEL